MNNNPSENSDSSQQIGGAENTSQLAEEKIEQESAPSLHSDAGDLTGADTSGEDNEHTTPGEPKSINNDR